jgi:hypothetical protein
LAVLAIARCLDQTAHRARRLEDRHIHRRIDDSFYIPTPSLNAIILAIILKRFTKLS